MVVDEKLLVHRVVVHHRHPPIRVGPGQRQPGRLPPGTRGGRESVRSGGAGRSRLTGRGRRPRKWWSRGHWRTRCRRGRRRPRRRSRTGSPSAAATSTSPGSPASTAPGGCKVPSLTPIRDRGRQTGIAGGPDDEVVVPVSAVDEPEPVLVGGKVHVGEAGVAPVLRVQILVPVEGRPWDALPTFTS